MLVTLWDSIPTILAIAFGIYILHSYVNFYDGDFGSTMDVINKSLAIIAAILLIINKYFQVRIEYSDLKNHI